MFNKITARVEGVSSLEDKNRIETELDVLGGVKNVGVDQATGELRVEFDENKISKEEILNKVTELGFRLANQNTDGPLGLKEDTLYVKGMHCASCEVLIEKRLLELKGVEAVEASTKNGRVLVEHRGQLPRLDQLNQIFAKNGYHFFNRPFREKESPKKEGWWEALNIALLIIAGFFLLEKLGLGGLVRVNSSSSLPSFFVLGLIAGVSSCAALVGGLVLSLSKQWSEAYTGRVSFTQKLRPHLLFNVGRLVSYLLFGALLGIVGQRLQFSWAFTSFLVVGVSLLMAGLGLRMLGVRALRNFQPTLPRFITRYVADEKNFRGGYLPFLMGAGTFFLPCGFTITAQGLALLSGSPLQGGLIMLTFALGTLPMLLTIGASSVSLAQNPRLSERFNKVAGILVLFFAIYNLNSQLNVLGLPSFNDVGSRSNPPSGAVQDDKNLVPIVDGKQIITMEASAYGYKPNYFKVKAGTPVLWKIADTGTSGCTNAIISRSLFDGEIDLTPGQTSYKEFTPQKPGKYKFSCWMGMISGTIEVVSGNVVSAGGVDVANAQGSDTDSGSVIPSGAKGCGCGGGSGSCSAPR